MRINLFYPAVVVLGIALVVLFRPPNASDVSFFGFAESNETAVNYNYPVVVNEILVRPGEVVRAGQPLLAVSRMQAKERLTDQPYRIQELRAEERIWRQRKNDDLAAIEERTANQIAELDTRIADTEREIAFAKSLLKDLESVTVKPERYRPLEDKLARLIQERARTQVQGKEKKSRVERELAIGGSPYQAQIDRLGAEAVFDSTRRVQPFTVVAPADGLIGNIQVKEDEHVPSYETLLSFYEPHSQLVSGYIHEDQTTRVALGDAFEAYSLKDPTVAYPAEVTGLGSRIVSIPRRLRKLADFETFGREVILQIPADNVFLQKEKVGLRKLANAGTVTK